MDADRYFSVMRLRQTAYELVQRSQFPMDHRCALLLRLARQGQKRIKKERWEDIEPLCDSFDPHQMLAQLKKCRSRASQTPALPINAILSALLQLDILTEEWKEQLNSCLHMFKTGNPQAVPLDAQFEQNLLFTFLFRYFARAAYPGAGDKTLLGLVKFAVFSLLAVRILGQDMSQEQLQKLAIRYSREVEHDEDNVEMLVNTMAEDPVFSEKAFCSLLLSAQAGL